VSARIDAIRSGRKRGVEQHHGIMGAATIPVMLTWCRSVTRIHLAWITPGHERGWLPRWPRSRRTPPKEGGAALKHGMSVSGTLHLAEERCHRVPILVQFWILSPVFNFKSPLVVFRRSRRCNEDDRIVLLRLGGAPRWAGPRETRSSTVRSWARPRADHNISATTRRIRGPRSRTRFNDGAKGCRRRRRPRPNSRTINSSSMEPAQLIRVDDTPCRADRGVVTLELVVAVGYNSSKRSPPRPIPSSDSHLFGSVAPARFALCRFSF